MEFDEPLSRLETERNRLVASATIETTKKEPMKNLMETKEGITCRTEENSCDEIIILQISRFDNVNLNEEHSDHNYILNDLRGQPGFTSLSLKKKKSTVCPECGHLVTASHFATHMNEMHYDLPNMTVSKILCSECGIFCKDNRAFKNHMTKEHYFKCQKCRMRFRTEREVESHEKVHETETFSCTKCGINFDGLLEYVLHANQHEASDQLKCVKCFFVTTKFALMEKHVSQHETNKVYTCDICCKRFFNHWNFKVHCEMHAGIKKYICDFCPKKFFTIHHLRLHRDLNHHRELYGFERSYNCNECGRGFKFEKSLKRHLSCIHKIGQDRTVICPVCSKKIANNYNLKVHMRLHTGETTNTCETCGKGYSTYKSYKKHVFTNHPGQVPILKNEPKALTRY